MELYQLYDFLHVSKYENISKAAQELNTSQPSVSKAIQSLEEELNVKLFNRNGKRISLTRSGKILTNRLTPLMSELESILKEIQLQENKNIETIRINSLSGGIFLPEIIKLFKRKTPNVFFEIMEKRESTCWDLCIRSVLPEISYNTAEKILEEQIFLAVHKDSLLASKSSVSLQELNEEVFVFLRKGTNLRMLAEQRFHEENFFPQQGYECDTMYILQQMVQSGVGVTLWPQYTWGKIGPGSSFEQVRLVPIALPDFTRSIYLLRPKDTKPTPVVGTFCQYIHDFYSKLDR